MKKILFLILTVAVAIGAFATAASASKLGSGSSVIAKDVNLIKTGLVGQKMTFSDTDFKTALGMSDIKSVKILTIPSAEDGTLTLEGKAVSENQTIKRRNLSALAFTPAGEDVSESSFTFTVSGSSEEEIVCVMKFIEKVNYAPKVVTDTEKTLNVTTQRGISVFGQIEASDPEGDDIDFIIVSYPKYGALDFTDEAKGEFRYTPNASFSGNDSFIFVVRDEYGNYSKAQTVSLKITERMSEVVYVDMTDSKNYNAAVAMTAMGIMSGKVVGDDTYFSPNETVTRAEFVAMAMKSLSLRADSTLTETFFDDNDKIPKSLVGYVATAAKCGIINGSFEDGALKFRPNDAITRYEAAIIMANLLNVKAENQVFSYDGALDIPIWARTQVGAMYTCGIFTEGENYDMNANITKEDAAEYLYKLSSIG